MNILIVDDRKEKYGALKAFLEESYPTSKIDWAKNFHAAKVNLRDKSYGWVMLDMSFDRHRTVMEESNFAGLAGLHVLQFMKRARVEGNVIVCTSHTKYSDPDFGVIDGIDALNRYVSNHFREICRGCIYMGADPSEWQASLRRLIADEGE